ncbi:MAG: alcohol dehydrogenase catalytic domain-containing protein [Pseudoxanthomonas sp.]
MKLVQANQIASVEDYRIIDVEQPAAGPSEVLIEVAACGMGYVDALVALGGYQVKPPVPFTPGQEIAGSVVAIEDEIDGLAVGDRVMATAFGGGLAEYVVAKCAMVVKIPDNMTFAQAAGFRINYILPCTAFAIGAQCDPASILQ